MRRGADDFYIHCIPLPKRSTAPKQLKAKYFPPIHRINKVSAVLSICALYICDLRGHDGRA
jgi:hypothetical protein